MKIWLIVAAILLVSGIIVFIAVMAVNDWDFKILNTDDYICSEYDISETITDISINTDTLDIKITESEDNTCKVVINEYTKKKHSVSVQDSVLTIKSNSKSFDIIGIHFNSPKITIYLPQQTYESFLIENTTGDVFINIPVLIKNINVKSSTGDIILNNTPCFNTDISVTTGDIVLKNISSHNMNLKATTGDISFHHCTADTIEAKTTTGDVTGIISSNHEYVTETTTGDINVPKNTSGGLFKIKTTTGDIIIKYKPKGNS